MFVEISWRFVVVTKEQKFMFIAGWQNLEFSPRTDIKVTSSNKLYFLIGFICNIIFFLLAFYIVLFLSNVILIMLLFIIMEYFMYSIVIPNEFTWKNFS
jgi:hypothetical protein